MSASVVAHRGAYLLGQRLQLHQQLDGAFALQVFVPFERLVEVIQVGLMVLVVMDGRVSMCGSNALKS
jgi:hypothetical protein